MIIDRERLIQEERLRIFLRKTIMDVYNSDSSKLVEQEGKLRGLIRKIIREDIEKSPHRSTGINVLEDLLKKIVPQLEQEYKKLTTDKEQRESFRTHIINAVQNTLAPSKASAEASDKQISIDEDEGTIDEEEINISVGDSENSNPEDEEGFIDIDGSASDEGEMSDEEEFSLGLGDNDSDETGRNMAFGAFNKIETSIVDSYGLLANDEDRELFYDYLLTNLKLYFDKFEDELSGMLPEPTTPEYENEKDDQEKSNEEGESASEEGGDDLDLDDTDDEDLDLDL